MSNDRRIVSGSNYGDPRAQAHRDSAHGLSDQQIDAMHERMSQVFPEPVLTKMDRRPYFEDMLPDGATFDPRPTKKKAQGGLGFGGFGMSTFGGGGMGGGGGSGTFQTPQRPYQPELESPDRQMFPVHRILANRYWRLFYKMDPVIGTCIEMLGNMPWSDFQLHGEGVNGDVRDAMEEACSQVNVRAALEAMTREYLAVGEATPHLFFDEGKGIWTYCAQHNPDQLDVIATPFIKMDPIVEFIPDDKLRAVLSSNNRMLMKVKEQMPPELISRLVARQNIPLSPINFTFIPRRMHPYETRGTSIISRMWRILLLEDSIFNATIQAARRASSPVKIAKLGNPTTGWIPPPEHEQKMLQLLAQAEADPQAWIVTHYGVQTELVGVQERVMQISGHIDTIERYKLIALGINKGFLTGDATYASSITGLSVFMQRLMSLRHHFINAWLLPKFFKPMAKINGWVKRSGGPLSYRVKRSQAELERENRYIMPTINWAKTLDSNVNSELVQVIQMLEGLGCKFSKSTKFSAAGKCYEEEAKKNIEEMKFEAKLMQYTPAGQAAPAEDNEGGGGGGGLGGPPPAPENTGGEGDAGGDGAPAPEGVPPPEETGAQSTAAGKEASDEDGGPSGEKDPDTDKLDSSLWDPKGRCGNWKASEVEDLLSLVKTGETDSPFWEEMNDHELQEALASGDAWRFLEVVENHLAERGYPREDYQTLRRLLDSEGVLRDIENGEVEALVDELPDDGGRLRDAQFNAFAGAPAEAGLSSTGLYTGVAPESSETAIGDVSHLMPS